MNDQLISNQYIQEAVSLENFDLVGSKSVCWESPSNIALIKYWGKHSDQLPQNPSLSFNLKHSKTVTKIIYQKRKTEKPIFNTFLKKSRTNYLKRE